MDTRAGKLILLRHGESVWNEKNIFTGCVDIPLSRKGIDEALVVGSELKDISIDSVFTSPLMRAQMTALLVMSMQKGKTALISSENTNQDRGWNCIFNKEISEQCVPVYILWELRERMYGALQGNNKEAAEELYGKEQIKKWRRDFNAVPPQGESLRETFNRVVPCFERHIRGCVNKGKTVLVCAHGNSLRCILMFIQGLSESEVFHLEVPIAFPYIYSFEAEKWRWEGV